MASARTLVWVAGVAAGLAVALVFLPVPRYTDDGGWHYTLCGSLVDKPVLEGFAEPDMQALDCELGGEYRGRLILIEVLLLVALVSALVALRRGWPPPQGRARTFLVLATGVAALLWVFGWANNNRTTAP